MSEGTEVKGDKGFLQGLIDAHEFLLKNTTIETIPSYVIAQPGYVKLIWRFNCSDKDTSEYDRLKSYIRSTLSLGVDVNKLYMLNEAEFRAVITPNLHVAFETSREAVCTKRVVGTREVAARVIPAHVEEIVEWDCNESTLK